MSGILPGCPQVTNTENRHQRSGIVAVTKHDRAVLRPLELACKGSLERSKKSYKALSRTLWAILEDQHRGKTVSWNSSWEQGLDLKLRYEKCVSHFLWGEKVHILDLSPKSDDVKFLE